MSHVASAWAWKQNLQNPIRKMILLFIADAANPEKDWNTWHSFRTISEACNCSVGSVSNHMGWLVDNGYLTLIRHGKRQGETNRYRLNVGSVEIQIGPSIDRSSVVDHRSSPEQYRSSVVDHRSSVVDKPVSTVIEPVRERNKNRKKLPPDFVEMVTSIHAEILPELEKVVIWSDDQARARYLMKIWQNTELDTHSEDFWRAYFGYVRTNDWWMGRVPDRTGKCFRASFEFLVNPKQFVTIVEACLNEEAAA